MTNPSDPNGPEELDPKPEADIQQALVTYGTPAVARRFMEIADVVAPLIKARGWAVQMAQGSHIKIEGWTCTGALMGIGPRTETATEIKDPETDEVLGYEAAVLIVKAVDGLSIGRAIGECRFDEVLRKRNGEIVKRWLQADGTPNHHACKSMAQTRASSKALASWCRPVIEMAGYKGTPAEEMPPDAEPEGFQNGGPYGGEQPGGDPTHREPGPSDDVPATPNGWFRDWLDDEIPVRQGEYANASWRTMCGGSPDGLRHKTLRWIIEKIDNKRHTERAELCCRFIEHKG